MRNLAMDVNVFDLIGYQSEKGCDRLEKDGQKCDEGWDDQLVHIKIVRSIPFKSS